jgi:hypothetical protein
MVSCTNDEKLYYKICEKVFFVFCGTQPADGYKPCEINDLAVPKDPGTAVGQEWDKTLSGTNTQDAKTKKKHEKSCGDLDAARGLPGRRQTR